MSCKMSHDNYLRHLPRQRHVGGTVVALARGIKPQEHRKPHNKSCQTQRRSPMKQFLTGLFTCHKPSSKRPAARPSNRARLTLEPLEERWAPSTLQGVWVT